MRGTFVPAYALNNFLARLPVLGFFLGGGQNEGVFGMTYEVVGPTGNATLRVNPIVDDGAGLPAQDLRIPQRRRQQGRAAVFLAVAVAELSFRAPREARDPESMSRSRFSTARSAVMDPGLTRFGVPRDDSGATPASAAHASCGRARA